MFNTSCVSITTPHEDVINGGLALTLGDVLIRRLVKENRLDLKVEFLTSEVQKQQIVNMDEVVLVEVLKI